MVVMYDRYLDDRCQLHVSTIFKSKPMLSLSLSLSRSRSLSLSLSCSLSHIKCICLPFLIVPFLAQWLFWDAVD